MQFEEERERFKEENDSLHKKAANTEREKAELHDALEKQATKLRESQEHYEKELNKVRAELQSVKREIQERQDQVRECLILLCITVCDVSLYYLSECN